MIHLYVAHLQEYTPLYCLVCGAEFQSAQQVADHLETSHANLTPPLEGVYCPICGSGFQTLEEIFEHLGSAHGIAPPQEEVSICPICHEQFSTPAEVLAHHYLTHFQEHNPPGEALYCLVCGAKFQTPEEVASHLTTAHANMTPPLDEQYCPFCDSLITGEEYGDQYEMYVHWANTHDWWPEEWEPPTGWWPGDLRPPRDWAPPENWEVPENLREDVIPPYMSEQSWKRPENWKPREDWVPSERWKPSSSQPLPEVLPENLEAVNPREESYHWIPPENEPFWMGKIDNATTEAPVGFYVPDNSTPFVRQAENWIPVERLEENVYVGGINMCVKENGTDVVVTTLPLEPEDLPEDVSPPGENFCEFFQVGVNVSELVENVEVGIKVDKDWIAANNLDEGSLTLERCVDGVWIELPTEVKGEDENYLYLSAPTEGFSLFAVTGTAKAVVSVPGAEEFPWYLVGAGVGVVVVLVALALSRKRKP